MPDFNDSVLGPLKQLLRFLYLGKEKPEYQPGNWFVHDYYSAKNLPCIDELAAKEFKHVSIISSIIDARDKKLIPKPETLIFALAVCAQQDKNEDLRKEAYDAVTQICISPEHFILFIKFCSDINKNKDVPRNGWNGWKRAVKNWYFSKSPMELARNVTQCKSRYGWKHKDIMKLAHLPVTDPERNIVFQYVMYGYKKMQELNPENKKRSPSTQKLISYLKTCEDVKHCVNEDVCSAFMEHHDLTVDQIPSIMIYSDVVCNSVLFLTSLTELLQNLQRIHNLEFLRTDSFNVPDVLDLINELRVIQENIHPAVFLITVRNYENRGKPLSFVKRKALQQGKGAHHQPPAPNKQIIDALNKMLNFSFTNLRPTDVHYMITISTNPIMFEHGCWQCGNVTAAEAGCLIALSLLHVETNVTMAIFKNNGIQCIDLDRYLTLAQMMNKLECIATKQIDLSKPMSWAIQQKKTIDVFINIVDQIYQKSDSYEEGIKSYRMKMNLQNAKLVNCALCANSILSSTYCKNTYDRNILSICGFDENVPKIIEAFARSYF